jgi:hypothetical protein
MKLCNPLRAVQFQTSQNPSNDAIADGPGEADAPRFNRVDSQIAVVRIVARLLWY